MPKLKKLTRQQRKDLIVAVVHKSDEPMTTGAIARSMNLANSPYLRTLLKELQNEGVVISEGVDTQEYGFAILHRFNRTPRVIKVTPIEIDSYESP